MIRALKEKLGKEIEELSFELTVTLPKAIATAVEMGDLRENSEYKAALERQQLVQARLSQLHQRLQQVMQLSASNTSPDKVGLGSTVTVKDTKRYADSGGWGFFNFNHSEPKAPTAKVKPTEECAAFHIASAKKDQVWTQFYRLLDD